MRARVAFAAGLVVVAGCGRARDVRPVTCDFVRAGVCVANPARAPSLSDPSAPDRFEAAVDASLAFWGGHREAVAGWAVVFEDGLVDCGDRDACCSGCAWLDQRTITLQVLDPDCFEATMLAHEIGHAVLETAGHADPRFGEASCVEACRIMHAPGASPECARSLWFQYELASAVPSPG
jgi:hypothetical protein